MSCRARQGMSEAARDCGTWESPLSSDKEENAVMRKCEPGILPDLSIYFSFLLLNFLEIFVYFYRIS